MTLKNVDNSNLITNVLNGMSYAQTRHIVLLETLVELVKLENSLWDKQYSDSACGVADAEDVLSKMIGCESLTVYNYARHVKVNEKLFSEVPSANEDQRIVYLAAISTSKYKLCKLIEK